MKTWTHRCLCEKNAIKIKALNIFDKTSINHLYCPKCLKYAEYDTIVAKLPDSKLFETTGWWGIKYNSIALKDQDKLFENSLDYYLTLFHHRISFNLPYRNKIEIIGIKGNEIFKEDLINSKKKEMFYKSDGKPSRLPKKKYGRLSESPIKRKRKL